MNGGGLWVMAGIIDHMYFIFGHKFFNARVSNIINKKEVHNWYNVKNGTYSAEEAENIFDSYFDGCKAYRGMVLGLFFYFSY